MGTYLLKPTGFLIIKTDTLKTRRKEGPFTIQQITLFPDVASPLIRKSNVFVPIIQLAGFEHTRYAHGSLTLFIRLLLAFKLLLFQEQICVVTGGEFFKLNEEVSKRKFEADNIIVVVEKCCDERRYLRTIVISLSGYIKNEVRKAREP